MESVLFDGTMGTYDEGKVCQLVSSFVALFLITKVS